MPENQNIEWKGSWKDDYLKENTRITNKIYQELCEVSKSTATRDLSELVERFKLLERTGDIGAGTIYKLIGS